MADSLGVPVLKLPQIRPSSNTTLTTDRPLSIKQDTDAYEQWRASIHRQLEEDLQRQVQQVLEENERQERLAKLRRQYLRAGQFPPPFQTDSRSRQTDPLKEIDRRNRSILQPLKAKEPQTARPQAQLLDFDDDTFCSNSFNFETYASYCLQKFSSQKLNNELLEDSTNDFEHNRKVRTKFKPISTVSTATYGTRFVKSNRTDLISTLNQQATTIENMNIFSNKYGILISSDGPFWPQDFRILHPTPKLLSREVTPKEFYLTVADSSSTSKF